MNRLQFRQTVVVVVLTVGALSLPKLIARRWAISEREGPTRNLVGAAFTDTFGR